MIARRCWSNLMRHLEIWETINEAVHGALEDGLHRLDQNDLLERADALLRQLPTTGGTQPTSALLLRRYCGVLQKELCLAGVPRPRPEVIEDEGRELTRAVMVAMDTEGFSVETAVLLALAIRAGDLAELCSIPAPNLTARGIE